MALDITNTPIELTKNQLNNLATDTNIGTIFVDSTHDGLNPALKKSNEYEDVIFDKTKKEGDTTAISSQTDYFMQIDGSIYDSGYFPEDNMCYIVDVIPRGTYLKGLNQFLDSANTGSTCEFIDQYIKKYSLKKYNEITNLDKTNEGDLYLFQFYRSDLNINKNFDYTSYTNFDVLFFSQTMIKILVIDDDTKKNKFLNKLNDILKTPGPPSTQKNKFRLITAIGLNYLWQNLISYCINFTEKNPQENNYKKNCEKYLRQFLFIDFNIDKKKNIQYARYNLGYQDSPPYTFKKATLGMFDSLNINNEDEVTEFIRNTAFTIFELSGTESFPINTDTYTFYTSQPMCASNILTIDSNTKNIHNRNDESSNNERTEMELGLKYLLQTQLITSGSSLPLLTNDEKIYFYRLLKFQGDSSHLVFAHIIKESKNTQIHYDKTTSNYIKSTSNIAFNQLIITGERPLFCRAIQDTIPIQSKMFKKFGEILSIKGDDNTAILHNPDICATMNTTHKKLLDISTDIPGTNSPLGNTDPNDVHNYSDNPDDKLTNDDQKKITDCVIICKDLYEPLLKYYKIITAYDIKFIIRRCLSSTLPTDAADCKTKMTELFNTKINGRNFIQYVDFYNQFISFQDLLRNMNTILIPIIKLNKLNKNQYAALESSAVKCMSAANISINKITNIFQFVNEDQPFKSDLFNKVFPKKKSGPSGPDNPDFIKIKQLCQLLKTIFTDFKDNVNHGYQIWFALEFPERVGITHKPTTWQINPKNTDFSLKECIYKPIWDISYAVLDDDDIDKQEYIRLLTNSINMRINKTTDSNESNKNINSISSLVNIILLIQTINCNTLPYLPYTEINNYPSSLVTIQTDPTKKIEQISEEKYIIFKKLVNKISQNYKLINIIFDILKSISMTTKLNTNKKGTGITSQLFMSDINKSIDKIDYCLNLCENGKIIDDKDSTISYTEPVRVFLEELNTFIDISHNSYKILNEIHSVLHDQSNVNHISNVIFEKIFEKGKVIHNNVNALFDPIPPDPSIQPTINFSNDSDNRCIIDVRKIIEHKVILCTLIAFFNHLLHYLYKYDRTNTVLTNPSPTPSILDDIQKKLNNIVKSQSDKKLKKSGSIPASDITKPSIIEFAGANDSEKKVFDSLLNIKEIIDMSKPLFLEKQDKSIIKNVVNILNETEYFFINMDNVIVRSSANTSCFQRGPLPPKTGGFSETQIVQYGGLQYGGLQYGGVGEVNFVKNKMNEFIDIIQNSITNLNLEIDKNKPAAQIINILNGDVDLYNPANIIKIIVGGNSYNLEELLWNYEKDKKDENPYTNAYTYRSSTDRSVDQYKWMNKIFQLITNKKYTSEHSHLIFQGVSIPEKKEVTIKDLITHYEKDIAIKTIYNAENGEFQESLYVAYVDYIIAYNGIIQRHINPYFKKNKLKIFGFGYVELFLKFLESAYVQEIIPSYGDGIASKVITYFLNNRNSVRNFLDYANVISIMNSKINIRKAPGQLNLLYKIIEKFTFIKPDDAKKYDELQFKEIKLYSDLVENEKIEFLENLYKIYNTDEYNFIDDIKDQSIHNLKRERIHIIDSLKFIYTDFQIKSFLNMKYHYNVASYVFGVKHLLSDPFNYSIITLYNEVYTYYNRIRQINTISEVADIIKQDTSRGIDIPNDLKVHYSPYDILKLLLSYEINFYQLEEEVFESWKKIVLSDIDYNSIVGDFLIPNKTVPYLDKLDYKYTAAIEREIKNTSSGLKTGETLNLVGTFMNSFLPTTPGKNIKTYSTVDFVMAMFKKLNLYIGDDDESIPNEIDINELYSLYSVLIPDYDICKFLVKSPKNISATDLAFKVYDFISNPNP